MVYFFFVLFVIAGVAALLLWSSGHQKDADRRQAVEARAGLEARLAELQREFAGQEARIAEAQRRGRASEQQLASLRRFQDIADAEAAAADTRTEAERWATKAKAEARAKKEEAEREAGAMRVRAADEAARIVESANRRAQEIAGDAMTAVREAARLQETANAMRNVIEGYGDRYVIPSSGLLDELGEEFSFTDAGKRLKGARETTRAMIRTGKAATCEYAEASRRATAIEFVLDAFNGKVDSLLADVRHDNYGTLGQKIRDAFVLVNHNGRAFRDARILPEYLDTRLEELRWAVAAQDLKAKEREEQRALKERIREEERAQREFDKAAKDAEKERDLLQRAMEKARKDLEKTTGDERARFEAKLLELSERLRVAEERNQRALSMAQQTKSGNVYVISNVGSFGEDVFKVGMTRRLEPLDRIRELGDASVPFEFDVHALIPSTDAPALERALHQKLVRHQVNKVNVRKEFFRVPIQVIREEVGRTGSEASWTLLAEAREYRESLAIERALVEKRLDEATWIASQQAAEAEVQATEMETGLP